MQRRVGFHDSAVRGAQALRLSTAAGHLGDVRSSFERSPDAPRLGVAAEVVFLGYVFHFGRKASRAGETGDIDNAPDLVPTG